MKKILHITEPITGGVANYLTLYLENSDKTIFSHYIAAPSNLSSETFSKNVKKIYPLEITRNFNLISIYLTIKEIKKIFADLEPDIVYIHSSFAGFFARIALIGKKTKIVYNPHGWSFKMNVSPFKKKIYSFIEKVLSLKTDIFIMISQSEYDSAIQIGINPSKLRLVYNSVDSKMDYTILDSCEELDLPENSYIIGTVGRLTEQKNPEFFLRFAQRVLLEYPDTYFVIVGDGELRNEVLSFITNNNLNDRILVTGWTKNPESYLQFFDQAVLFSRWEGLSLVIMEYVLYRKPILATDIGGINDLVKDGVTGFTFSQGDMATAVKKSKALRENKSLASQFTESAFELLSNNFDLTKNTKQLERIFEELID